MQERSTHGKWHRSVNVSVLSPPMSERYLIFRAPARGQGVGNMLQGLASALLLSERYNRQFCVWWKLFEAGFEHLAAEHCPSKESLYTAGSASTPMLSVDAWLELWNFGPSSTLADAQEVLKSGARVVVLQGNMLVEPRTRLGRAFDTSFKPTAALREMLAGLQTHQIAAHLRVAGSDASASEQRGIFAKDGTNVWDDLRRFLPGSAFVVSDSPEASRELGSFASPPWGASPHTATVRSISASRPHILRTWAEWSILRQTSVLLHTPSAFSETAWLFSTHIEWHCILYNVSALRKCALQAAVAIDAPTSIRRESEDGPIVQTEL